MAYDSIPIAPTEVTFAQDYEAHGIAELGNQVSVATTAKPLDTVVVQMVNFGTKAYSWPVTLNIYRVGPGNSVGSLLATDTQTFPIPAGVSVFNITFNFRSQQITLPSQVVYGIAFSTGPGPNGSNTGRTHSTGTGLAVGLAKEPADVTAGSDPLTGTGSDYIDVTDANGGTDAGGGYTTNFCSGPGTHPVTTFVYDPGVGGTQPCVGTQAVNRRTPSTPTTPFSPGMNFVPAVQLNVSPSSSEKTMPLVIAPGNSPKVIQPFTLTVHAGQLTLTCGTHDSPAPATDHDCTPISLGTVTLDEKWQVKSATGEQVIVSTARGGSTDDWTLTAKMVATPASITHQPFCTTVHTFCNATTTTSVARTTDPNSQITANYFSVSGTTCKAQSTRTGPTQAFYNPNPDPTAGAGGAFGIYDPLTRLATNTTVRLCTAGQSPTPGPAHSAPGYTGGEYLIHPGTYTLDIPPTVHTGKYYGTVQYTLVPSV